MAPFEATSQHLVVLGALGLSLATTVDGIAALMRISAREAQGLLDDLERWGLVRTAREQ
jgi:hypothetical protein